MSYSMPNLTEERLQFSSNLRNLYMEKNLSEYAIETITNILKVESMQGTELRYQTNRKIWDLLQVSETEQEFLEKLKEEFPEQFQK